MIKIKSCPSALLKSWLCTAQCVHWKVGWNRMQKRTVKYTEAPRHLRHLPTRLLGIIYKFVYMIQRHIQPKIENLEYETHGNWIFSIFLRVDSLKKKCLSLEYLWWFLRYIPVLSTRRNFYFPMYALCIGGRWDMAILLLSRGADPNKAPRVWNFESREWKVRTPLYFAAVSGSLEVCRRLLASGARLDLGGNTCVLFRHFFPHHDWSSSNLFWRPFKISQGWVPW